MCGIFGVASSEKHKNVKERREALIDGIWCNTLRGDHSTGFAAVKLGEEKKAPAIFKRALNGPDFLCLQRTKNMIMNLEDAAFMITHNRAATVGPGDQDENAHPFNFGHITLAHNGHVHNAFQLVTDRSKNCYINVDSAHVAHAMMELGEKETLERCTGNFAFTWHNTKDGTLNFARNEGRPLKFVFVKGENTMWWMSERQMLWAVLSRNGIKPDGTFWDTDKMVWYKFDINNLREYTTVPFVHRSSHVPRTTSAATCGAAVDPKKTLVTTPPSDDEADGEHSPVVSGAEARREFLHGARVASHQLRLIDDIVKKMVKPSPNELEKRQWELRRNSCRPTKARKVDAMSQRISTTGFSYDQ